MMQRCLSSHYFIHLKYVLVLAIGYGRMDMSTIQNVARGVGKMLWTDIEYHLRQFFFFLMCFVFFRKEFIFFIRWR